MALASLPLSIRIYLPSRALYDGPKIPVDLLSSSLICFHWLPTWTEYVCDDCAAFTNRSGSKRGTPDHIRFSRCCYWFHCQSLEVSLRGFSECANFSYLDAKCSIRLLSVDFWCSTVSRGAIKSELNIEGLQGFFSWFYGSFFWLHYPPPFIMSDTILVGAY